MNSRQKAVQQVQLDNEKKVLRQLKQVYSRASQDCAEKIRELNSRTDMQNLQSIIYQKQYQEALKKQLDGICDTLQNNQFTSIADYLGTSYEDGFIGTLFDLQGQGIPLIFPIDESQVVKALQTDTKLKSSLYKSLGEDVDYLKKSIKAELSRGIANGSSWLDIAAHIANGMNSPFNKALNRSSLIARTEGHRIQNQAALDCQHKAKDKGADVLKQWDSTLDKRTRKAHVEADGQIVELDEYFSVGGEEMEAPGVGGTAKNVCNCRCCLLQRARWALSDVEYTKMNGDTNELVKLEESDYTKFKHKAKDIMNQQLLDIEKGTTKLKGAMSADDYAEYLERLKNHQNHNIQSLYGKHGDEISDIKRSTKGYYSPAGNNIVFSYPDEKYIKNGMNKYSTLAHEYGHFFDAKVPFSGVNFKEIDTIQEHLQYMKSHFKRCASSSDEFLAAVRKDKQWLRDNLTDEIKKELRLHDASSGVQDAIDGLLGQRVNWGHGDKYYNRTYNACKPIKLAGLKNTVNEQKNLQAAYKKLGFDASNQGKVARICRDYESASEMWANIMAAEVNGGEALEYVKKYLPNSYQALLDILKGVQ